jgi:hypothetical protein
MYAFLVLSGVQRVPTTTLRKTEKKEEKEDGTGRNAIASPKHTCRGAQQETGGAEERESER